MSTRHTNDLLKKQGKIEFVLRRLENAFFFPKLEELNNEDKRSFTVKGRANNNVIIVITKKKKNEAIDSGCSLMKIKNEERRDGSNRFKKRSSRIESEIFLTKRSPLFMGENARARARGDHSGTWVNRSEILNLARIIEQFTPRVVYQSRIQELIDRYDLLRRGRRDCMALSIEKDLFALRKALKSLDGLARFYQMPEIRCRDLCTKDEALERRGEARMRRDLILGMKSLILNAYDEKRRKREKMTTVIDKEEEVVVAVQVAQNTTTDTNANENNKVVLVCEDKSTTAKKTNLKKKTIHPQKRIGGANVIRKAARVFGKEITNNDNNTNM